jgi:hypothetical protein
MGKTYRMRHSNNSLCQEGAVFTVKCRNRESFDISLGGYIGRDYDQELLDGSFEAVGCLPSDICSCACVWCGEHHDPKDCLRGPAHNDRPTEFYLKRKI